MSDSVDRVFSHALNTVNKIRTGSEKPPSNTRLKLYGLYKQAMEGDVEGIMERPAGDTDESKRALEKWESWHAQTGLSRTEAKRRYISLLIDTMHKYALPSPDARELVSELEFVWDQIKSNVPSSSSSSPLNTMGINLPQDSSEDPPSYPSLGGSRSSRDFGGGGGGTGGGGKGKEPMRVLSPVSQAAEEEDDIDEAAEEEFVDAPDSQYNGPPEGSHSHSEPSSPREQHHPDRPPGRDQDSSNRPVVKRTQTEQKWRRRMEQSVIKMTAEVAALREQLESRRLFQHRKRHSFFGWVWWFVKGLAKIAVINLVVNSVVLGIVLVYMRRKEDRRLEGAVRVLLGDAVAQVQRIGDQQARRLGVQLPQLPKISGPKKEK